LAAGALVLVRTHGAALLVAVVAVLLARRRWRAVSITAVAALAVIGPWQLWAAAHATALPEPLRGSYGSYSVWPATAARGGGVQFVLATVTTNVREVLALLADRFSLSDHAAPRIAFAVVAT